MTQHTCKGLKVINLKHLTKYSTLTENPIVVPVCDLPLLCDAV